MDLKALKDKLDYRIKRIAELKHISYNSEDCHELKSVLKESNKIFDLCNNTEILEIASKDMEVCIKCCQLSSSILELNGYTINKYQRLISSSIDNIIKCVNKTYEASVSTLEILNK